MGIPRKGSRKIVVDGVPYRYIIKTPGTRYDRWDDDRPRRRIGMVIVQEDAEKPGRPAKFGASWNEDSSLTPEAVARGVRIALSDGWVPSSRGSILVFGWSIEPGEEAVSAVMSS